MFVIRIALINILIDNQHDFILNFCKDYIVDSLNFDFKIKVDQALIDEERGKNQQVFSDGYLECICAYRLISYKLYRYNSFLLHASVVSIENRAHCLSAKSGVGKTYHTMLLKKLIPSLIIINGDKPIIRLIDETFYAFGTPWAGKEGLQTNTSCHIHSFSFIKRNQENYVVPLEKKIIAPLILKQMILPLEKEGVDITLNLLDSFIKKTNFYEINCNKDLDAARVSSSVITK